MYIPHTYIFTMDEYCVIKIYMHTHKLTRKLQPKKHYVTIRNYAKNVKPLLNYIQVYKMTWQRYDISDSIVMS